MAKGIIARAVASGGRAMERPEPLRLPKAPAVGTNVYNTRPHNAVLPNIDGPRAMSFKEVIQGRADRAIQELGEGQQSVKGIYMKGSERLPWREERPPQSPSTGSNCDLKRSK